MRKSELEGIVEESTLPECPRCAQTAHGVWLYFAIWICVLSGLSHWFFRDRYRQALEIQQDAVRTITKAVAGYTQAKEALAALDQSIKAYEASATTSHREVVASIRELATESKRLQAEVRQIITALDPKAASRLEILQRLEALEQR